MIKRLTTCITAFAMSAGLFAYDEAKLDAATPAKPYNVTTLALQNPSFENGFTGWEYLGMQTQSNAYFSKKSGTYYAESWVSRGDQLSKLSVTQKLTGIPAGRYRLTAATLHIQQSGNNSTANTGAAQTGACLFADSYTTPIDTMKDRSVEFVVLGNEATIGMKADNPTGNWLCVDNFRLLYLGRITAADQSEALLHTIATINGNVLPQHMQDTAREAITAAILYAQGVAEAPDTESLNRAMSLLDSCTAVCQSSIALYDAIKERIDYAYRVKEWVADAESKATKLQRAIDKAEERWNDFTLSDALLKATVNSLNTVITSVDKKIYTAQWSMGDVSNPSNSWYTGRSIQSKDWVLFWEKGYGDEVPVGFRCGSHTVNAWETIEHAQKAFDFYADSLHFINRSRSKTKDYKMVIRLRYTPTEWEATGSGIDDKIGLLTLTPWAQTSRNWQTVYHEVGHCFQYQTHCDKGDRNGWMYAIGPNGCAFWEQCAQWQAYKILPYDQFTNEWFAGYLSRVNKHILHETPRYENYFVQDYWTMLHGWDFIGRLWNESCNPEDAVQAYQRITGISNGEFNDEMWDCAARFATWDIPHLAPYHKDVWKSRPQPSFTQEGDDYWAIAADNAPENTGHNIIRLNVPSQAKTVTVCFEGLAGDKRYRDNYKQEAGWRYGFVAIQSDGTRIYGTPGCNASYSEPRDTVTFDCPSACTHLWLVVSGAAKTYRQHGWDDNDSNDEQWGYRIKFDNTNLYGKLDNHITGIEETLAQSKATGVFTLTGVRLRDSNDTAGLPSGIYIAGGRKILVK